MSLMMTPLGCLANNSSGEKLNILFRTTFYQYKYK